MPQQHLNKLCVALLGSQVQQRLSFVIAGAHSPLIGRDQLLDRVQVACDQLASAACLLRLWWCQVRCCCLTFLSHVKDLVTCTGKAEHRFKLQSLLVGVLASYNATAKDFCIKP